MKLEGHLSHDKRLFGKEFPEVHQHLDEFVSQGCTFYEQDKQRHCFEHLLEMYDEGFWNIEQLRAAIYHLQDDFGNEIVLKSDWEKDGHWLCEHVKEKCPTCLTKKSQ